MGTAGTAYLFAYNFGQTLGLAYILFLLSDHYFHDRPYSSVWSLVGKAVMAFQFGAILEVLHAMLGLVKSRVPTMAVQIASRVGVVALICLVPEVQTHWVLTLLLFSWAITEVVRYSFYTLYLFQAVPYLLSWLRYSLFIVLYPSGVSGEVGTIMVCLPYLKKSGVYSLEMPNALNFSISLYYICCASFAAYAVGLPWLYSHMLAQRKKSLSPSLPEKKQQ